MVFESRFKHLLIGMVGKSFHGYCTEIKCIKNLQQLQKFAKWTNLITDSGGLITQWRAMRNMSRQKILK